MLTVASLAAVVPDPGDVPSVLVPPAYDAAFTVVPVLVALTAVAMVVLAVRRGARYAKHGIDPTTADVDLMAQLRASRLLAPDATADDVRGGADAAPSHRPVAERLADLDRLRDAGTISADEHAAARAAVLREV